MGDIDRAVIDALLTANLYQARLTASYVREILVILNGMQRDLVAALRNGPMTDLNRFRRQALLQATSTIITAAYAKAADTANEQVNGVIDVEARAATAALALADASAVMPNATLLQALASDLLVHGAPTAQWWKRQGDDTVFRFSNAVRQGIAQAETNEQIVTRVKGKPGEPGILDVSRSMARKLVHASVQTASNAARLATFDENKSITRGVMQVSTMDGRTSDVCLAYSGGQWNHDREPIPPTTLPFRSGPPRHWNCRSVLVPLLKSDFPITTRASDEGQLPADLSMDAFLKRKSDAYVERMLGKGRAQLWRDGKISLSQLLDQSGNPISLEQLRARYA